MVLGKERAKGRAPDISLLTMAFNLPTPQDLRREAGRHPLETDASSSSAKEATQIVQCFDLGQDSSLGQGSNVDHVASVCIWLCIWLWTQGPTRHFYSELQHIQGHINQVNAKLSQNPGDKGLRHELQHLQNQLHSTLNTATAQAGFVGPSRPSEHVPSRSPEKKAQEVKAPEILVEECDNAANVSTKSPKVERAEVVREEAAASDQAGVVGPSRPSEHVPSKSPEKKAQEFKAPEILVEECDNAVNTRAKSPKAERAKIVREEAAAPARPSRLGPESPRLNVRHHLCSACGDVRSNTFHQKYPRILVRKPLLNYCGPCKEESIKHGKFVQRHHFCFGCGLVRSKDFEREHAATIGSPLLPNYCRRCRREVRDVESNVDASLVNSDVLSQQTGAPCGISEASRPTGHGRADDGHSGAKHGHKCVGNEETSLRQRRRARTPSDAAPTENLRITPISHDVGPASEGQVSSFGPNRRLGSAQRRAQRSWRANGDDFVSSMSAASEKTVYQRPSVQDAPATALADSAGSEKKLASPVASEEKGPSSSSAGSGRKTTYKSCLKGAPSVSIPDACSPPGLGSTGDGNRVSGGTPEGGSSGSKTVKFRSVVRVRHSHTRHSSNASSQVEFREAEIGPGDAPTAPRAAIARESPPFPEKSKYASIFQEPHDARHFKSDELGLVPPYPRFDGVSADSSTRCSGKTFGGNFGSASQGRESSTVPNGGPRQFDEGFPADFSGMFNKFASRAGSHEKSSSFRSSRGAFSTDFRYPGGSFGADSTKTDRRGEDVPGVSASSSPGNVGYPEHAGHYQEEYMTQGHSCPEHSEHSRSSRAETSSFRSLSRSRGYGSSKGANHTRRDNGPFGSGQDAPSSSSNPYYKPGYFATMQELFNRSRQSRASEERPSRDKQASDHDRVPEPIIEEPDSPPETPVRQMKLLELDGRPMSGLSSEEATVCAFPRRAESVRGSSWQALNRGPEGSVMMNGR
ncbi:hypothetical protein G6O67_006983 [Ophiocordyceps sinensis]|uniref:Uncharacterized protein n=1 Tax=Ophiocordyceps sinensis TaxID=72228 RepID=A0A8H4PLB8_9HYPO|nr:hypothetical protein G6O67_006983 [Ophiocordyceps sinensis]